MDNTAKRIAVIFTFLSIFTLLSGCQKADIKEVIVGKWYCVNDSSVLETFADGNMTVSPWFGGIDYGTYEIGDKTLTFQTAYGHQYTDYQNMIFGIRDVTADKITLDPIGGSETFVFVRYAIRNPKLVGKWKFEQGSKLFNDEEVQAGTIEFKDDNTVTYQSADSSKSGNGTFCFIDENNIAIFYSKEKYGVARNVIIKYMIDQIDDKKLIWETGGMKEELAREQ